MRKLLRSSIRLGQTEFVSLMALMSALTALSIDAIMPAFPEMEHDLHISGGQGGIQLVIIMLFAGMSVGQLILGPLSDTIGRKPPIVAGLLIFCAGSLCAIFSDTYWVLMVGRFLQGFGLAGPRAAGFAMMRDLYKGNEMARIISFILIIFMLVPVFAPSIGQLILFLVSWRVLFTLFMVVAIGLLIWFVIRQGETLAANERMSFSMVRFQNACREVIKNRQTLGYTLASGLIFGAFDAYLSLAQPLFHDTYHLGSYFPMVFASMAIFIGVASFVNSRLVLRLGARKISDLAALLLIFSSFILFVASIITHGRPPLWQVLTLFPFMLFASGMLFGNQNALAMEPIGHVAGMGAAIVTSTASILGVLISLPVIRHFENSITPLAFLFVITALIMALLMRWGGRTPPCSVTD